jgi:NADH:ubiquinone oxidoreductase subunit 3 (subunit A)
MGNGTYLPIFVLLLGAIGFAVTPLALAWLWAKKFSPQKPGHDKNSIYECGLETKDDAWAVQFKPGYYLYAIIFLVFDIEAVFLLPFATIFTGLRLAGCMSMLVFVMLLVAGLVWAYKKNVLTWS